VGANSQSLDSKVTSSVRDVRCGHSVPTMKIKVFLPGDVAQIVIEYLHHMSSMIKCRGVSSRWHLAVENAVFFLNGRNNSSFDSQNYSHYHTSVAGLAMKLSVVNFGATLKELTVMNVSVTDADLALLSARCPVLETLVIGHSNSLQQPTMQLLRNVRRLRLTANRNLSLLTKITRAVKLQTLEVTDCKVFRDENLSSICGLQELTTLDLRGCLFMSGMACISSCRTLTSLVMDRTSVSDTIIATARRCTALTTLSLKGCRGVTDLRALKDSPGLQVINAAATNVDQEGIDGLQRAPMLTSLTLKRTKVRDVSCLVSSTSLTQLDLSETSLGDDEIRCLARMPQLRVLRLCHCPLVTDVRALIVSSSITTLSLQQALVTDQGIAGLERMPSLSELVVAHTGVTDVRQFAQRTMPWRLVVDVHTRTTDDQVGVHVLTA
jgi:Leucine-rich repeat (LRR) protein